MTSISIPFLAPAPDAVPKVDSSLVHVDTDAESTGTNVSKPSSEGEMVESPNSMQLGDTAQGKVSLLEPLQKQLEVATHVAVIAIQEWWAKLEPLLLKLQAQMLEQLDPYIKASAVQLERFQEQLAPYTKQAAALVDSWKATLEPHAKRALEAVQAATEAVRVQAYEPALAAIATASTAVQAHVQEAAALVSAKAIVGYEASREWLAAQQPAMQRALEAVKVHAAAALAALLEWKKQIEPLVIEQLHLAQKKAITMSLEAGARMQELAVTSQAQMVTLSTQIGEQIETAKVAAAPHAAAAKVWVGERALEVRTKAEPAIRPIIVWSEETGKKLETVLQPVGKAINVWALAMRQHIAVLCKQLEAPTAAFQKWLADSMQCLCLPIKQQLDFKAAKSEDYPPPVYVDAKPVD